MENPATWGVVIRLIDETIHLYHADEGAQFESLARFIYRQLRAYGLCVEDIRDGIAKDVDGRSVVVQDGRVIGSRG